MWNQIVEKTPNSITELPYTNKGLSVFSKKIKIALLETSEEK